MRTYLSVYGKGGEQQIRYHKVGIKQIDITTHITHVYHITYTHTHTHHIINQANEIDESSIFFINNKSNQHNTTFGSHTQFESIRIQTGDSPKNQLPFHEIPIQPKKKE